ncbi:altered inheritance rate of mitochondria protein 25-like isoform X2 [Humulus lupulus]|uniref:altered inheritance rate of mitochondria protein 25-like isoform X2 n=1 Tax=Humulus lupulus TaxID=3486 RepID=UPI002B40889C|nr:altered inheritance rate of mitochondria protein 25-like isoform X2 [Humulus lupulus]
MNWARSWRCLTKKLHKSTPEVSKISSSRYYHRVGFQERLILPRNPFSGFGSNSKHGSLIPSRHFGKNAGNDIHIGRDFLAQLWVADGKMNKKTRKVVYGHCGSPSPPPVYEDRLFSSEAYVPEFKQGKKAVSVPFPGLSEYLRPETPEEVQVEPLLARSNLLITRDIEWANLVLGFEQENRYAIVDVCYPQSPVGLIREQSNVLARQFLRLRRPFVALVTDAEGNELFRVRRPFWWINSSIYAEVNGKEVGVVHRRWHLWRRIYDLYLGNKQFAVVENPGFWNWTFTLKDINGNVLAEIDRDWRGFGFELFTDAGQYVIRFGSTDPSSKHGAAEAVQDLEVFRPLSLSERAVAVALAISLDNDYFSRHGGWGLPLIAVGE